MSRKINQVPGRTGRETRQNPIAEYLAALEETYPLAKGKARVTASQDNRVIVSVPLPARATDRMRLFDQMAEVGTRLLIETNQHIVLSSQ